MILDVHVLRALFRSLNVALIVLSAFAIGVVVGLLLGGCGGAAFDAALERDDAAAPPLEQDGAADAPRSSEVGSAPDDSSANDAGSVDQVDAGDASADAPSCADASADPPSNCGCQAAPACSKPARCTWRVGPQYCPNGLPECTLVEAHDPC